MLFTSLILCLVSLFVWTEWKALRFKFWLVLQLIPSHYCWIIAHYLYPSCHNNSWMPVCDNVLTARALTWWEKWKQKHDSVRALTACTLFCLIEFHCEAVQHTPLKTYHLNEEMCVQKWNGTICFFVCTVTWAFCICSQSNEHVCCCLCACRMGLPVDSPDRNDDAHKYEQPGEEEGGDNQTETCIRSVLPAARKKRKCKKRYFTAGSPPYVLLQLFPTAGIFPLSTLTVMIL